MRPLLRAPKLHPGVPSFVAPDRREEYLAKQDIYNRRVADTNRFRNSVRSDRGSYTTMPSAMKAKLAMGDPENYRGAVPSLSDRTMALRNVTQNDSPYQDEMRFYSPEKADAYTKSQYTAPMMDENLAQARDKTLAAQTQTQQILPDALSARQGVDAITGRTIGETEQLAARTAEIPLQGLSERDRFAAESEAIRSGTGINERQDVRQADFDQLALEYQRDINPELLSMVMQKVQMGEIGLDEAQTELEIYKTYEPQRQQQQVDAGQIGIDRGRFELGQDQEFAPQERKLGLRGQTADVQINEGMVAPTIQSAELANEQQAIQNELQQIQGEIAQKQARLDLVLTKKNAAFSLVERADVIEQERVLNSELSIAVERARVLEDTLNNQQQRGFEQGLGSQSITDQLTQEAMRIENENARVAPEVQQRQIQSTMLDIEASGLGQYIGEDGLLEDMLSTGGIPSEETVSLLRDFMDKVNRLDPVKDKAILDQLTPYISRVQAKFGKSSLFKKLTTPGFFWNRPRMDEASNIVRGL